MFPDPPKKEVQPKRELYCETHDVKVQLSNLEKHPFPCVLRVGQRMRCHTHKMIINADQVKIDHSKCEVGPYNSKKGSV